jgi:arsenate reductase
MITEQQLMDIADRLDMEPFDLINGQTDEFRNHFASKNLTNEDILKVIKNNPSLLRTPIAILKDDAYFVSSPYEFVKKGLIVEGIQSRVDEKNKD